MRSPLAILLLFVTIPVSAAETTPASREAESINDSDATLSQARAVLERWERVLTEEGADRMSASNVCRMYLDAWASVDLDRAIELEWKHRCRSSQSLLVQRLAAAHRWDDVLAIMDADPEEFRYRQPEFWSRVACYGARIGDVDIVDLAGRRVEIVAASEPSEAGRPPRPSEGVALARFYVAASRLELLRQQYAAGLDVDTAAQSEHVLRREQSKELRVAMEDLWRAAGGIVPQRSWFQMTPEFSAAQGFAALESWEDVSSPFGRTGPETDNFVQALVDAFHQERPAAPRCQIDVVLPDLSHAVTSAWLTRQVMLGRTSAALTTLWSAPGSSVDRARILAIMSRSLPSDEGALAASWCAAADGALRTVADGDDSTVRAFAELSLAYSALGDIDNAARCIDAALDAHPADADDARGLAVRYESRQVLLQAVAALPEACSRLPEVLEGFGDREFGRARLAEYQFQVDGLTRQMDLTHVIPDSRILEEVRDPSHADYHQPHDAGDWLGAMEAAVRHHAGNAAWASSYRTLAEESVREIGLAATLVWCADVADPKARFAAEIAAVAETLRARRMSLPGIDADDPRFVAPSIVWPNGC